MTLGGGGGGQCRMLGGGGGSRCRTFGISESAADAITVRLLVRIPKAGLGFTVGD